MNDLVTTEWLQSNLPDRNLRIVDCRWILGEPGEGRRQYEAGHIPGAIHLDVEEHLSAKEGPGRHPLPTRRNFEKTISSFGITREIHVIVYDEGKGIPAARLWWLLKYYGHDSVSVLDGGMSLWIKEGRPLSQEIIQYSTVSFAARPKRKWVVNKEDVDAVRDDPKVLLIDARAPERYSGEVEPIDSKGGHIPGAENLPYTQMIDSETGKFLSPDRLKDLFKKLEVNKDKEIICYCGSGVTACTNIFALKLAGFDSQLYEGSWSDWSKDNNLSITKK